MVNAAIALDLEYPHLKGKPHWRRTLAVYAALDNTPTEATYEQLIEAVEQATGKRCSRKLISKWKEEKHLRQLPKSEAMSEAAPSAITLYPKQPEIITPTPQTPISIENYQPITQRREWLKRITSIGIITTTLVGLSWILTPEDKHKPLAIAEPPSVQTTPTRKPPALEPREIKIELSLISPQDLKVKPGDKIAPGQILSDRTTERQRLLNQKKQLELSLKQLEITIPQALAPKSLPSLQKLPPISYQQEKANIFLKQQELKQAETAIANQQEKIKQLTKLIPNTSSTELPQNSSQTPDNTINTIIEHEKANLKQLEETSEKARLELTIAQTQLTTAKERRQQEEYQLHLEENRRAIALQNQQIELERQKTIRSGQLQEREYSKAQIQAKIQEVENAIAQLSTVKAPYSGTVKKVKWVGQNNHTLTVELTLDLDDESTSRTATMPR